MLGRSTANPTPALTATLVLEFVDNGAKASVQAAARRKEETWNFMLNLIVICLRRKLWCKVTRMFWRCLLKQSGWLVTFVVLRWCCKWHDKKKGLNQQVLGNQGRESQANYNFGKTRIPVGRGKWPCHLTGYKHLCNNWVVITFNTLRCFYQHIKHTLESF